jgi:hypothetical protein
MGAGASLNDELLAGEEGTHARRFFCHECHQITRSEDYIMACGACNSSFIEEMETRSDAVSRVRQNARDDSRGDGDLNQEQTRRLANAAIMLRLLERQLQSELETVQSAYHEAREKEKEEQCLSPMMKLKLRRPKLDTDTYCNQPICPICSDDFAVGSDVLQLPCGHIFHEDCAIPWLDTKKTCPICRYLLTNDVPSISDLEKNFSAQELSNMLEQEKKEETAEKNKDKDTDTGASGAAEEDKVEKEEPSTGDTKGPKLDESGGVEHLNKTRLARELVEVMGRRQAAQEKAKDQGHRGGMSALLGRQGQSRPGFRTMEERIANPSPSNRTLREVIEEGERERARQMSERRERMRALGIIADPERGVSSDRGIVSNALRNGSGTLPSIRGPQTAVLRGAETDGDFARALTALLQSTNMGLEGRGQEEGSDDEDPPQVRAAQTMPMDMSREINDANASLEQARTALASAREDSARLGNADLTPHGITRLGSGVPTTFVIRSNGNNNMQIERRAALREAIDSID